MSTKPPASDSKTAKVVSITSALKKKKDRWPEAVMARGYTQVPSILLWGQARLGLEPDELNVLLQIISHRWTAENDPYLSKGAIARRMGKSERMVQRHLTSLEDKGFITRMTRNKLHKGQDANGFNLSGLLAKLTAIAPEFEKAADQNKRRRAKTETKPS